MAVNVDIDPALRGWINAPLEGLAGREEPLAKGVLPDRPRSPGRAVYATLTVEDHVEGLDAEGVTVGAEVEFTTHAVTTHEASRLAALALMRHLMALSATRPVVDGVRLLMAAPVTWPERADSDSGEYSHTVRATVYAGPV